ncbi:MAG TPA: SRPBCC family protein [Thermoanaerobaculia bacterium]|nr:SRPBCC family protein [Thermoanaerobaculia bacterium]
MRVTNVHARRLPAAAAAVGPLLDSLATDEDRFWPHDRWPAMRLAGGLAPGAAGGHGPIRYLVEEYAPGARVRFRFTAPRGFHGHHRLEVEALGPQETLLRHVLEMEADGRARLSWPLVFRPLHDALLEDALDRAERALGGDPPQRRWSPWVRLLRRALRPRCGRARPR